MGRRGLKCEGCRTQTGLSTWLVFQASISGLGGSSQMLVSFCPVAWARLADLLLALHAVVCSQGGPCQWLL
jgi:hypothetical protein